MTACPHDSCIIVDSGYRVGLVCCWCLSCTYDGSFVDPVFDSLRDPVAGYPAGAALSPVARLGLEEFSWVEIIAIGIVNGTRDSAGWTSYLRSALGAP